MTQNELREALLNTRRHDPRPRACESVYGTCSHDDTEAWHSKADDLLVQTLRGLGYGEAMDIYEACERWFA